MTMNAISLLTSLMLQKCDVLCAAKNYIVGNFYACIVVTNSSVYLEGMEVMVGKGFNSYWKVLLGGRFGES